jgi:hypothetical protein
MSESILAHNVPPMKSSPGETLRGALNNEELQSLLQRHNLDVNLLKRSIPSGTSSKSKIERPEYATRYTADDVMRNYRRLLPISPNIVDFPKVFPELADKSPAETITALAKRFKKNPTVNNSSLLQAAINKFSATRGGGSQSVKRAIGEAKKLFHRPNPGGDNTALDDIWFNAFVDENYGGGSLFLDMPQGFSSMGFSYVGSGFNDKLTSLQCGCFTTEVGGYVILFQDAGFSNNYLKYTLTGSSPGNSIGVPNVGKSFNDQTSSIMMIRRFPDELGPFSFASFVPPGSITDIVNGMSPNVSTNGDPIYTWDLWPNGANYHPNDPFKQFVYIRVSLSA